MARRRRLSRAFYRRDPRVVGPELLGKVLVHGPTAARIVEVGEGVAVLLRAGEPLEGLAVMQARRPAARRARDLCRGPARLCQALGLDRAFDGADLVTADREVTLVDDGTAPPDLPANGVRIGLRNGAELPWRWWVPGDPHVSRPA